MNNGWIKLHRQIVNWEWYGDLNTRVVFFHLLLTVNHEDKRWKGQVIERGERITSLGNLAEEVKLSVRSVRTALTKLKSTNEVTSQTTNRFTKIRVQNFDKYQITTSQSTIYSTNERQTNDKQTTTTKEVKKVRSKEVKKEIEHVGSDFPVLKSRDPQTHTQGLLYTDRILNAIESRYPKAMRSNRKAVRRAFDDNVDTVDLLQLDDFVWAYYEYVHSEYFKNGKIMNLSRFVTEWRNWEVPKDPDDKDTFDESLICFEKWASGKEDKKVGV